MIYVVIGFFLRFLFSIVFANFKNNDVNEWFRLGKAVLNRVSDPGHASYFPLIIYFNAFSVYLERLGFPYAITLKIIYSFFDCFIIYLIYLLTGKDKKSTLFYALNPISIMVTCIHGQFDAVPLFFLLFSIYFWKRKNPGLSSLSMSFGVGFKTWPLLFSIPILKRLKKNYLYLFIIPLVPLFSVTLYLILFKGSFWHILRIVVLHRGVFGWYGLSWLVESLIKKRPILQLLSLVFLISFAVFSFLNRKKDIIDEILDQMLFFFIFTISIGIQWFMWLTPFLIIKKPKFGGWYFLFGSLYVAATYVLWTLRSSQFGIFLWLTQLLGVLVWLSIILLARQRIKW